MERKFEYLVPLIENFLFRKNITIIAGAPTVGKTRFGLMVSRMLAAGIENPIGAAPPLRILYCSERDWAGTCSSLQSIGLTLDDIPANLEFFCIPDIPKKDFADFELAPLTYLSKRIFPEFKPDMVNLDTISYFQSMSAQKDITSYGNQRRDLLHMKRWASEHNVGIWAMTHSPKQAANNKYEDPFAKVIGSTAIMAATTAAAVMERINDDYLKIYFRSHITRMDSPRYFTYLDYREVQEAEAMAGVDPMAVTTLSKRQQQVLELIPFEWVEFTPLILDICDKLQLSDKNVYNIIKKLLEKSQIVIDNNVDTDQKMIKRLQPS